jgi:hypothetical protein
MLINLDLPIIVLKRKKDELSDYAIVEFTFNTSCYFYKDNESCMFSFKVLGFGITISRQWDY